MTDITDLQMTVQRLAERVAALEAERIPARKPFKMLVSKEWCMRMAAAEEGYSVEAGILHPEAPRPEDTRPTWQRANVGDRVEFKWGSIKNGRGEIIKAYLPGYWQVKTATGYWDLMDEDIIAILPPEPERPKDETVADGHASDCATHNEPAYPNGPCDCGVAPSPASLDALKAADIDRDGVTTADQVSFAESLRGFAAYMRSGFDPSAVEIEMVAKKFEAAADALGLSERVKTETDVRERARKLLYKGPTPSIWIDVAVEALASAGLLASAQQPQPVKVNWNEALTRFYAATRAPHGAASDGLLAVLRSIPGIVIED
jgi:hypothetical protein